MCVRTTLCQAIEKFTAKRAREREGKEAFILAHFDSIKLAFYFASCYCHTTWHFGFRLSSMLNARVFARFFSVFVTLIVFWVALFMLPYFRWHTHTHRARDNSLWKFNSVFIVRELLFHSLSHFLARLCRFGLVHHTELLMSSRSSSYSHHLVWQICVHKIEPEMKVSSRQLRVGFKRLSDGLHNRIVCTTRLLLFSIVQHWNCSRSMRMKKKHADDERTGTVENGKEISKFVEHKNYPLRMRERELVQFPSHAPVIKR